MCAVSRDQERINSVVHILESDIIVVILDVASSQDTSSFKAYRKICLRTHINTGNRWLFERKCTQKGTPDGVITHRARRII